MGAGISVLILITVTYFWVSLLKPRNFLTAFIYGILLSFAQIISITQLLSLFEAFRPLPFLTTQLLILIATFFYWYKNGKPLCKLTPFKTFQRIFRSIKQDNALIIMGFGFVFFLLISGFLATIMDITSGDGAIYHVARSFYWVVNSSLQHFETSQVRMLAFPINSEILYAWLILFKHNAIGIALFSFIGFITTISALFGLMNTYSINRRLWVIFLVSSFSSVLVQASGTETDIIIAALILSSMFLFKESLKHNEKTNLYIASLAYAIALGTKTTAAFLIPAVAIFFCYHSYLKLKKDFYKPLLKFIGFGIINFIIFSSYNYILNIMSFGNPLGAINTIDLHKNSYGLAGGVANFIKNCTLFFDFTGFTWNTKVAEVIIPLRDKLLITLNLWNIPDGINTSETNILNNTLVEPLMGWGVLGFLTFLPACIISFIRFLFSKTKIATENAILSGMFFLTIFIMSYSIVFMTFNNRFISTYVLICAPILGCLYFKKHLKCLKGLIVFLSLFYLTLVSTHLWARPAIKIINALTVRHETLQQIRERNDWQGYNKGINLKTLETTLKDKIREYPTDKKIAMFVSFNLPTSTFFELIFAGYNIDFKLWETIDTKDLKNYDIVIDTVGGQESNIAYKNTAQDPNINCSYYQLTHSAAKNRYSRAICEPNIEFLKKNFDIIDSVEYANKTRFAILEPKH